MNHPEATAPQAPSLDLLQQQVEELVDQLFSQAEESVFRRLCRLAHSWKIDPEDFRRMLLRARLRPSRASEIKAVLLCPEICVQFIRRTKALSWKNALKQARGCVEDPVTVAAANLIRELFDNAAHWPLDESEAGWKLAADERRQFRLQHADGTVIEVLRRPLIPGSPATPNP